MGLRVEQNLSQWPVKEGEESPSVLAVGGGHCPVCRMEKLISRRPSTMKMSGLLYLTQPQNFKGHKSQFELMAS